MFIRYWPPRKGDLVSIGGFLSHRATPIIHFWMGFSITKNPAMGVPHLWKPPYGNMGRGPNMSKCCPPRAKPAGKWRFIWFIPKNVVLYGVARYFMVQVGFETSRSIPMLLVDILYMIWFVVSKCFSCFTLMPTPAFLFQWPKETTNQWWKYSSPRLETNPPSNYLPGGSSVGYIPKLFQWDFCRINPLKWLAHYLGWSTK